MQIMKTTFLILLMAGLQLNAQTPSGKKKSADTTHHWQSDKNQHYRNKSMKSNSNERNTDPSKNQRDYQPKDISGKDSNKIGSTPK
jgi:hypothetical protein